jgi:hypothetical protein
LGGGRCGEVCNTFTSHPSAKLKPWINTWGILETPTAHSQKTITILLRARRQSRSKWCCRQRFCDRGLVATPAGVLGLARNAEKRYPRRAPRKGTFHVAGTSATPTTGHRVLFYTFCSIGTFCDHKQDGVDAAIRYLSAADFHGCLCLFRSGG